MGEIMRRFAALVLALCLGFSGAVSVAGPATAMQPTKSRCAIMDDAAIGMATWVPFVESVGTSGGHMKYVKKYLKILQANAGNSETKAMVAALKRKIDQGYGAVDQTALIQENIDRGKC